MAAKVDLGGAPAARCEMTYEEAEAFSITAGGFWLIPFPAAQAAQATRR